MLSLGVLDLVHNVADSLLLVEAAERLGYERYWVAEHAPQPSPTLICSLLAQRTRRIRIGSAGVLLHSHNPARTAFDYQLLEKMYPGRVEMGFCGGWFPDLLLDDYLDGRSPAIRRDNESYGGKVVRLTSYLRRSENMDRESLWSEASEQPPDVICMGTGERSAALAARCGVQYAYSLFHTFSKPNLSIFKAYAEAFRPDPRQAEPKAYLAVSMACAETEAAARTMAENYQAATIQPNLVGNPDQCVEGLQNLADLYGVEHLVVLDLGQTLEQRLCNYQLLAEAFGLGC